MNALAIFCGNCRFYYADEVECRRHAPQPRFSAALSRDSKYQVAEKGDDDTYNDACWPCVHRRDWCGEFVESGNLLTAEMETRYDEKADLRPTTRPGAPEGN